MAQRNTTPENDTIGAGFAREGAIQCFPPGVNAKPYRLNYSVGPAFREAITSSLAADPSLTSVELLAITGPKTPSVSLHGSRVRSHNTGHCGEGSAGVDRTVSTEVIMRALEETLPEWYGVESGELILDPVGSVAVPTSRVMVVSDEYDLHELQTAISELFSLAHSRHIPMLYQVLVRSQGADGYRVIVRIALIEATPRPLRRNVYATELSRNPFGPLDDQFIDAGFSSSRHLAGEHWRKGHYSDFGERAGVANLWTESGVHADDEARSRLELLDSRHEYRALLEGKPATRPYNGRDAEPTLTVADTGLDALVSMNPLYSGTHWPSSTPRSRPRYIRDTVAATAAGTDHSGVLARLQTTPTGPTPNQSQPLLDAFVSWLQFSGAQPNRVSDRDWGTPHLRGGPRSETTHSIVANPNATLTDAEIDTPAALLMAANEALTAGEKLLVVTPAREAARWAHNVLAVPYVRRLEAARTELYQLHAVVRTAGGKAVVARRDDGPFRWSITPKGTRRLENDNGCLAEGSVDTDLAAYEYETARAWQTADGVVVDDDGTESTYPSVSACTEEYQFAGWPVVPVAPLFVENVDVVYREGTEFVDPTINSRWADPFESASPTEHLEDALESFIETYTRPVSTLTGHEATNFEQRFTGWYKIRTAAELNLWRLPNLLPDDIRYRTERDDRLAALRNRQWWLPTAENNKTSNANWPI